MFKVKMLKDKRVIGLLLIVVLLLLLNIIIFMMSSQEGTKSHSMSKGIVLLFKDRFAFMDTLNQLPVIRNINFDFIVRKIAHFTEFFFLSMIIYWVMVFFKPRIQTRINMAILGSLIFAFIDEFHQVFVSGRTPTFFDIIVDMTGASTAMVMVKYINHYKEKKKEFLKT